MPAVSQSQQKLMAQAYQVKKFITSNGKEGIDPNVIDDEYKEQIVNLANSMSRESLKKFAETKLKDLPKKKIKEGQSGFLGAGPFPQYYSFAANISPAMQYSIRDNKDNLVKSFMDFINGNKKVKESVPAAVGNTVGMGNVSPPAGGEIGSGDRFDNNTNNDEENIGLLSYEAFKKKLNRLKKNNSK